LNQARAEDMPLMTADAQIAGYSVDRIAADRLKGPRLSPRPFN
jgi:hypothetical protein